MIIADYVPYNSSTFEQFKAYLFRNKDTPKGLLHTSSGRKYAKSQVVARRDATSSQLMEKIMKRLMDKLPRSRILRVILLTLLLSLTLVLVVSAASTAKTLSTNFTLINFGSSVANVHVDYFKDDGSAWTADAGNTDFTIPADGGQKIIRQYFDGTLTAGQGSAVVSSDQPLGSVAQILARGQTPTSGAYTGFSATSSTFYVPLVTRRLSTSSGLANSQIMI